MFKCLLIYRLPLKNYRIFFVNSSSDAIILLKMFSWQSNFFTFFRNILFYRVGYSSLRLHNWLNIITDVMLDFLLFDFLCPSKTGYLRNLSKTNKFFHKFFQVSWIFGSFDWGICRMLFSTGFDSCVVDGCKEFIVFHHASHISKSASANSHSFAKPCKRVWNSLIDSPSLVEKRRFDRLLFPV